jgi:hypothetical protein
MIFERIDIQNGSFTTEELNPLPEETRLRVYNTIMNFEIIQPKGTQRKKW